MPQNARRIRAIHAAKSLFGKFFGKKGRRKRHQTSERKQYKVSDTFASTRTSVRRRAGTKRVDSCIAADARDNYLYCMPQRIERCSEFDRLQKEVNAVLEKLTELTTAQREAFRAKDGATFSRLDKELEQVVGRKERAIGALRQHAREHRCQETAASSF